MISPKLTGLFYITHVSNVPSILERGILSHQRVEEDNIDYVRIYDANIVASRRETTTPDGNSLWHFTNLYFQPRNPMLYRVLHEVQPRDIAIISVRPEILDRLDIFISTGNAAHSQSDILPAGEGQRALPSILKDTLPVVYWKEEDGSKRKIMAECLVPTTVSPDLIQTIYVATSAAKSQLEETLKKRGLPVIAEPNMFFLPSWGYVLTPTLTLVQGDMFFSRHQTITISVNTRGVMGKGLASRAKYQFPGVYVQYQDLCRSRKLRMGKPYLYKRESSLDYELADEPRTLANGNLKKWFLLFPTKNHWRERADINGIEEGLAWITRNYVREGINSLAIPALGCGLGKLDWRDVGPLMCRYLSTLDIPVAIYLPAETEIDMALLTKNVLLP